jgi:hypothetical protein
MQYLGYCMNLNYVVVNPIAWIYGDDCGEHFDDTYSTNISNFLSGREHHNYGIKSIKDTCGSSSQKESIKNPKFLSMDLGNNDMRCLHFLRPHLREPISHRLGSGDLKKIFKVVRHVLE